MSQADILDLLKKEYPRWLDTAEMSNKLGITKTSVNMNLVRMRKHNKKMKFFEVMETKKGLLYKHIP